MFERMVGYDAGDPQTGLAVNRTLPTNYTQFLAADGLLGARLGVVRSITDVSFADAEVMALYDGAILELKQQGTQRDQQHGNLSCWHPLTASLRSAHSSWTWMPRLQHDEILRSTAESAWVCVDAMCSKTQEPCTGDFELMLSIGVLTRQMSYSSPHGASDDAITERL